MKTSKIVVFAGLALLASSLAPGLAAQDDPNCPAYPRAVRADWQHSLELDQQQQAYQRLVKGQRLKPASVPSRRNSFIDHRLFNKMQADSVSAAPVTGDEEFLRRVYIDLTGRIPSAEQAEAFLNDSRADKRALLINELLASQAFTDQFARYFSEKFRVTRGSSNVGLEGRNAFYGFVRDFVARDRSYAEFIREMLTAEGEVDKVPGTQFFARNIAEDGPIHDTWDNTTDQITTQILGFKTECISCHNGRGYLDKINVWLTRRTRQDFWQMSAYLSRMNFLRWSDDAIGFRPRVVVIDRDYGNYSGAVNTPGNRPARANNNLNPAWILDRSPASSGNFRRELAEKLTADRQFARATVNYLWAYFFGDGIVDPPDAWDLARIDPKSPPPEGWPMQNSNPELLEDLADAFIAGNFKIRELARLITNSTAYQLSSRYSGEWRPAYVRYFAKHEPRRMTAEELYDSIITATRTEAPMTVLGWERPVTYANQLPDPTEPATDGGVANLLTHFGRGNWLTIATNNGPTLLGLLYSMIDGFVVNRSLGFTRNYVTPANQVLRIHAMDISDEEAIRRMFLATLSRRPTEAELASSMAYRNGLTRDQWLSDLQWALLNKLDFIFNY
jgi:hypothetical protein